MNENDKEKEIDDIKKELEVCLKAQEEYLEGWKRAKADMVNYKREDSKRMEEIIDYCELGIIFQIIGIVDDFKIAEKEITEEQKNDNLIKGFLMIREKLNVLLRKLEVEEIASLNKQFDPNFQEAVAMVDGEKESELVMEEVLKGYIRRGRVIRPAKVKVIK